MAEISDREATLWQVVAQRDALAAQVATLTAERDALAARLAETERALVSVAGAPPMMMAPQVTVLSPEASTWEVRESVGRAFDDAAALRLTVASLEHALDLLRGAPAERDRMRPVVEAAIAWAEVTGIWGTNMEWLLSEQRVRRNLLAAIERYQHPAVTDADRDAPDWDAYLRDHAEHPAVTVSPDAPATGLGAALANAVRRAIHIADPVDVTDWQRGYRACANRVRTALDEPTPDPARLVRDTRAAHPDADLGDIGAAYEDYWRDHLDRVAVTAELLRGMPSKERWRELLGHSPDTPASPPQQPDRPNTADEWNARYPVGTRVIAWPGVRNFGRRLDTVTRTPAWTLGSGVPVVSVEGKGGGIALTHVDVVPDTPASPPHQPVPADQPDTGAQGTDAVQDRTGARLSRRAKSLAELQRGLPTRQRFKAMAREADLESGPSNPSLAPETGTGEEPDGLLDREDPLPGRNGGEAGPAGHRSEAAGEGRDAGVPLPGIEAVARILFNSGRTNGIDWWAGSVTADTRRVFRAKAEAIVRAAAPHIQREARRAMLAEFEVLLPTAMCVRTAGHDSDGVPCSTCRKESALLVARAFSLIPDPAGSQDETGGSNG